MKYALGVDVGGTNIRIAVVDEEGNMYDVIKESTKARSIEGVKEQIISLVNRMDLNKYIKYHHEEYQNSSLILMHDHHI